MSTEIDITLPSGICFHGAVGMLKAKFAQWPWERYDADPPLNPNAVTKADIDRVYQLGARTSRAAYEHLIDVHEDPIAGYLKSIPAGQLENIDLEAIRAQIVG